VAQTASRVLIGNDRNLTRAFTYGRDDRFELTMQNLANPYGRAPLAKLLLGNTWSGKVITQLLPWLKS
jgi:hypothetical protein